MTPDSIPEDWQPPTWLSGPGYSKRELQWLCDRLDTSNRSLRIVNRQLSESLAKLTPRPEEGQR